MATERLDDVRIAANFAIDLPGWIRQGVTAEEASDQIRRRLADRSRTFVTLADSLIYANPESPYLVLLRHAGCEPDPSRQSAP